MPVASGSGQPRYVPAVDERDQGELSDYHRLISFHLAKFLRHEVPKRRMGDWVDVETILAELESGHDLQGVTADDLLRVVQQSHSKDKRRFEDWTDPKTGKTMVQAANADHYRSRNGRRRGGGSSRGDWSDDRSDVSDWSNWSRGGSSFSGDQRSSGNQKGRWRPPGTYGARDYGGSARDHGGRARDYGGSARFPEVPENEPASSSTASWPEPRDRRNGEAHAGSQAEASGHFEGSWVCKEGSECRIHGKLLTWLLQDAEQVSIDIYLEGTEIWVPDGEPNSRKSVKGWLSDSGQQIEFSDGDVWRRKKDCTVPEEATVAAAAAPAPAADAAAAAPAADSAADSAAGAAAPTTASTVASAADCSATSPKGGEDWQDMRVKLGWRDGSLGDEYLTLEQGELLSVSPALEDGWAFGYSYQKQKYGWFPPTYAHAQA